MSSSAASRSDTSEIPRLLARHLERTAPSDYRPIVTISPASCGPQVFDLDSDGEVFRQDTQIVADVRVLTVPGRDCTPGLAYAYIKHACKNFSVTDYGRNGLSKAISSLATNPDFDFRVLSREQADGVEDENAEEWRGARVGSTTLVLHDPTAMSTASRLSTLMAELESAT